MRYIFKIERGQTNHNAVKASKRGEEISQTRSARNFMYNYNCNIITIHIKYV